MNLYDRIKKMYVSWKGVISTIHFQTLFQPKKHDKAGNREYILYRSYICKTNKNLIYVKYMYNHIIIENKVKWSITNSQHRLLVGAKGDRENGWRIRKNW